MDGYVVFINYTIIVHKVIIVTRNDNVIKIIIVKVTIGFIANVAVIIERKKLLLLSGVIVVVWLLLLRRVFFSNLSRLPVSF